MFSLLTQPQKNSEAFSLPLSRSFLSSSSTIVAQQSSNLWPSFLLQITKGGHFRSREARLYVWDFEISGLGGLLSHLIFVGIGFWEIWWVVLLGFCFMMIMCEGICGKHVKIAMFGWVKHTHSVLGFLWWCLWCLYAEIADGKLLEMKGRTNLGLESENMVLWVEKEWGFESWKAKSGFSGNWGLKWVNPSLKFHLGLKRKLRLCKWGIWVTKVKTRAISMVKFGCWGVKFWFGGILGVKPVWASLD